MEWIHGFFDLLLVWVVIPLLKGAASVLGLLLIPLAGFSPAVQVLGISVVAALVAWRLGKRCTNRNEARLQAAFREKMTSLKHVGEVGDAATEKVLRKGINDAADRVYEELVMDKFFHMGITYFIPMFAFLIWLDYSVFPAEVLEGLHGTATILTVTPSLSLSTASLYLIAFNLSLLAFKITGLVHGKMRVKQKVL